MMKNSSDPEKTVFGVSPLGGNSVEGANIHGVPLFWDERVKAYISEQAVDELNDRDVGLLAAEEHRREEEFQTKAGIRRG